MKELKLKIEDLISQEVTDYQISKVFKTYYKNYLNSIDTRVETTGGKDFFIKHTKHTDEFLKLLYSYILRKNFNMYLPLSSTIPISLVALGSYGREQLCIYSDIDIMVLYEDIKGYNLKSVIEEFITLAWDCGLKLGSRVHEIGEINDVTKKDITIKSSILESRLVSGSKILWFKYENILKIVRLTNPKEFVLEKLEEHRQRLLKNPLKMEPNIKDGYGGMRESNLMFWIATSLFGINNSKELIGIHFSEDEYKKYRQALEYIFQVRNALHNVAKKKQDQVTFDILPELSTKLGFEHKTRHTKERQCMSKLFSCLHIVHNFSSNMIKKYARTVVIDIPNNLALIRANRFKKNRYIIDNTLYCSYYSKSLTLNNFIKELIELPNSVEIFDRSYIYFASKTKLPSKQSKELKKNIKTLLSKENLYPLLKLIYNAGLFKAVIPSTKKIIDQPQFDGYHQHPVDIHSLKTLQLSQNIKDCFIKSIYDSLDKKQQILVRLVSLFHDMGKGRKEDHHIVGEKLFKSMMRSFNFDEDFIKKGATLIRYHNMMSYTASHEDIYSYKTIIKFTGLIQTQELLKILYIVTYADISAVGENIFTSSTAILLQQLYKQSLPAFENKELLNESTRRVSKQNAIKNLKQYKELPNIVKKKISYISSNQIFLRLKAEDILDIVIKAKETDTYIYKILNKKQLVIRIIRKIPLNLGYLLGKLEFLNISTMDIYKLYDDKKAFEIAFTEKIDELNIPLIEQILEESFDMSKKVKIKTPIIKKENIKINCNHTTYLASMHLIAKDQKGLLAYIAKVFDDFGVDIESAKLYTQKGYARDLILIEKNGNFCSNQEKIVNLLCDRCEIEEVLEKKI